MVSYKLSFYYYYYFYYKPVALIHCAFLGGEGEKEEGTKPLT